MQQYLDFLGQGVFGSVARKFGDQFFDGGLVSMADLEHGVEQEPEVASRHFELGRRYLQDAKFVLAQRAFDQALQLAPSHPQARVGRACAIRATGKPSEAIDALHHCLDEHPDYVPAAFALEFCTRGGEVEHELSAQEIELELASVS